MTKSGFDRQIAFLPQKFCRVGQFVDLLSGEDWDKGWQVKSVSKPFTKKGLDWKHRANQKQRQASDI